jgi:phosphate transport system substrate-binding protein
MLAVVVTAGVAGCTKTAPPAAAEAPTVMRISGSAACMPLLHLLTDTYDGGNLEWWYVSSPGSTSGVKGAASGELDIGAVSRELTEQEQGLAVTCTKLSDDGLVFALHPSVGLTNLTSDQICRIYDGTYTNWSELGGPDLPIVVLDRHEDEPSKAVMRDFVFGHSLVVTPRAVSLFSELDIIEGVADTYGAIGYFSLGYGISHGTDVIYPALDGVTPSVETIHDGSYRIVRLLGIATSNDPSPEVRAFLDWATSEKAAELLESNGYPAVLR